MKLVDRQVRMGWKELIKDKNSTNHNSFNIISRIYKKSCAVRLIIISHTCVKRNALDHWLFNVNCRRKLKWQVFNFQFAIYSSHRKQLGADRTWLRMTGCCASTVTVTTSLKLANSWEMGSSSHLLRLS